MMEFIKKLSKETWAAISAAAIFISLVGSFIAAYIYSDGLREDLTDMKSQKSELENIIKKLENKSKEKAEDFLKLKEHANKLALKTKQNHSNHKEVEKEISALRVSLMQCQENSNQKSQELNQLRNTQIDRPNSTSTTSASLPESKEKTTQPSFSNDLFNESLLVY